MNQSYDKDALVVRLEKACMNVVSDMDIIKQNSKGLDWYALTSKLC